MTPEKARQLIKTWETAHKRLQALNPQENPIEAEVLAAEMYWASTDLNNAGYRLSEDHQWFYPSEQN